METFLSPLICNCHFSAQKSTVSECNFENKTVIYLYYLSIYYQLKKLRKTGFTLVSRIPSYMNDGDGMLIYYKPVQFNALNV